MNPKTYYITGLATILAFIVGRYVYPSSDLPMQGIDMPNTSVEVSQNDSSRKDNQYAYSDITLVNEEMNQRVIDATIQSELESLKDELSRLVEENQALKDNIKAANTEIINYKNQVQTYLPYKAKLAAANAKLDMHGLLEPDISLEELKELIDSPFAEMIVNSPFDTEAALKHAKEEQDYVWGGETQQLIRDFFITHELGNQIKLTKVNCKTSSCEINGYEQSNDVFEKIMTDISKQPWWEFVTTSTYIGFPHEEGKLFYTIVTNRNKRYR